MELGGKEISQENEEPNRENAKNFNLQISLVLASPYYIRN
jgi:hypothetical protein